MWDCNGQREGVPWAPRLPGLPMQASEQSAAAPALTIVPHGRVGGDAGAQQGGGGIQGQALVHLQGRREVQTDNSCWEQGVDAGLAKMSEQPGGPVQKGA